MDEAQEEEEEDEEDEEAVKEMRINKNRMDSGIEK